MNSLKTLGLFFICFLCVFNKNARLHAQQINEVYNKKIKEYTTDPKFLPSSVLNLIDDPKVPSPLTFFGEIIGAPGVMHRTSEIYNYYKQLAQTSPYISMKQVGTTEEGRAINLIVIAKYNCLCGRAVIKNIPRPCFTRWNWCYRSILSF